MGEPVPIALLGHLALSGLLSSNAMATRPFSEAAESRFAPYIWELQEYFATSGLRFGTPEDIPGIMKRLREPGIFSKDLSSLVRSFILRQGGELAHAQLIEILSFAIAGPEMARSPQQYREPLRELLAFVTDVMKRPWNLPPGERIEAEIVPFPDEYGARRPESDPVHEMDAAAEIAALPEIESEPAPPQSSPILIDRREPIAEATTPPLVLDDPLTPDTPADAVPPIAPNPEPNAMPETVAPRSAISEVLAAESERMATPPEPILPIVLVPEVEPILLPMLRSISTAAANLGENDAEDESRRSAVQRRIVIAVAAALLLAAVLVVAYRAHKAGEVDTVPADDSSQSMGAPTNQVTSPASPQTSSTGARLDIQHQISGFRDTLELQAAG
jgi:hypothetical protein